MKNLQRVYFISYQENENERYFMFSNDAIVYIIDNESGSFSTKMGNVAFCNLLNVVAPGCRQKQRKRRIYCSKLTTKCLSLHNEMHVNT